MNSRAWRVTTAILTIFVISFLAFYGMDVRSKIPSLMAQLMAHDLVRWVAYACVYFIALKSLTLGVALGVTLVMLDVHRNLKQRLGERKLAQA